VVYWKMLEAKNPADTDKEADDKPKIILFLRYFTVFNIAQCDGLNRQAALQKTHSRNTRPRPASIRQRQRKKSGLAIQIRPHSTFYQNKKIPRA